MSFIINPYSFGFNPLSLSPALWLSDTGSDPAVWPDLSGNGRNATQATVGAQPAIVTGAINGRQVRRFNGLTNYLQSNSALATTTGTIFVVSQFTDLIVADRVIFQAGTNATKASVGLSIHTNRARKSFIYGSTDIIGTATTNATSMSCIFNASGNTYYQDGTLVGSVSVTGISCGAGFTVGSLRDGSFTTFYKGDIAEILVFPTALSTTDRQAVESYLRTKWGTPAPFDPLSLSPALWLSDTGSDQSVWPDLSGNGRNATAGAGQQPAIIAGAQNGRQVRRFDGSNDYMSCGNVINVGLGEITLFAVTKINSGVNVGIVGKSVSAAAGGRYTIVRYLGNLEANGSFDAAGVGPSAVLPSDSSTAMRVLGAVLTRGTSTLYVNGSLAATASYTAVNTDFNNSYPLYIGAFQNATGTAPVAGFYLNGDIAEIFIFQRALSTTDRQAVESYLRTKWGTP